MENDNATMRKLSHSLHGRHFPHTHTQTRIHTHSHACGQSRTATTGFGQWERTLAGLLQLSSHRSDIVRQMTRCGSH